MASDVTTNITQVNAKLAAMDKAMRGKVLEAALMAGMLPIQNHAKAIVHKISGTLARSIHSQAQSDGVTASGRCGTNVDYARAEEFRNGGGHAYLRPAYDAEKGTAVDEVAAALKDILEASI